MNILYTTSFCIARP